MLSITEHAVERFVQRIAPGTSAATARARLEVHAATAAKLKQKTPAGDQMYLADGLCRLVVRPGRGGDAGHGVVITVLPLAGDADVDEVVDDPGFDVGAAVTVMLTRPEQSAIYDREQLVQVKAEAGRRMALANGDKPLITALNRLLAHINADIKSSIVAPAESQTSADIRKLRRALGKMIHKYGWNGNEAEFSVYREFTGKDWDG